MSASLVAVGLSHRDADVALRESVHADADTRAAVREALAPLGEVVVLSTCNRAELYLAADDPARAEPAAVAALLERLGEDDRAGAAGAVVARHGVEVPRHLFRVAAGLESVVPGEPEILGQVRVAWLEAQDDGTAGPLLNALFQRALEAGKRVRTETTLARRPASVASAAVELGDRAAGGLRGKRVVVLGAGAMARAVCSSALRRAPASVTVVVRDLGRGAEATSGLDVDVAPFPALRGLIAGADLVVAATSAPHVVLAAEAIRDTRRSGRLVVVDLGVPRNVDPAVGELDCCRLYDVDDLRLVVEAAVAARGEAAAAAEALLEHDLERFREWLVARALKPQIERVRARADEVRRAELARLLAEAGPVDARATGKLERLAAKAAGRFVHEQVSLLKAAAA